MPTKKTDRLDFTFDNVPQGDEFLLMDYRIPEPDSPDVGKPIVATGVGTYGLGKRTVIHVCTANADTSVNAMVLDINNSDVMAGDCLLITFGSILNSGIRFNNSNTTYNVLYQGSVLPNDGRCLNAGDTWMVRFANNSFNLLFRDREHYEDAMLGDGAFYPNAVRDYDGNWYSAVIIGNQVWMAENLRTTHYDDGTAIAGTSPGTISYDTPYWIYPNNAAANKKTYGLLYNWPAIMHGESGTNNNPSNVRGIAPTGFHVPSESELEQLLSYLNGQKKFLSDGITANHISKALASSSGWDSSSEEYSIGDNPDKNNKSGFGLRGAGVCTNSFSEFRKRAVLATCTNQTTIGYRSKRFFYDSPTYSDNYEYGYIYSSVRCVSDLTPEQFRAWYVDTYGTMQHHIDPLLTGGERILINSDGNYSIDLTNRSVTVINFADGVTQVGINFGLNALGDRQVVFKCDNEFSVVNVSIGDIFSNMSIKYLRLRITSAFTINGDNPRFCVVSNRIADGNICVLTSSAISTASGFGSGNTNWTPDSLS